MLKIRTDFWDVQENAPGRVFASKEELDAFCLAEQKIPGKIEYFSDHVIRHGKYMGEKVAGMTRDELTNVVEDLDRVCAEQLDHIISLEK